MLGEQSSNPSNRPVPESTSPAPAPARRKRRLTIPGAQDVVQSLFGSRDADSGTGTVRVDARGGGGLRRTRVELPARTTATVAIVTAPPVPRPDVRGGGGLRQKRVESPARTVVQPPPPPVSTSTSTSTTTLISPRSAPGAARRAAKGGKKEKAKSFSPDADAGHDSAAPHQGSDDGSQEYSEASSSARSETESQLTVSAGHAEDEDDETEVAPSFATSPTSIHTSFSPTSNSSYFPSEFEDFDIMPAVALPGIGVPLEWAGLVLSPSSPSSEHRHSQPRSPAPASEHRASHPHSPTTGEALHSPASENAPIRPFAAKPPPSPKLPPSPLSAPATTTAAESRARPVGPRPRTHDNPYLRKVPLPHPPPSPTSSIAVQVHDVGSGSVGAMNMNVNASRSPVQASLDEKMQMQMQYQARMVQAHRSYRVI
ncbi:hypothetical protein M427DRAFT_143994 [Gonapodya prolifera JEL478]|uniref:Uncharacterized protein n=1 Tax=Gonapodya prolifera (strain JEL478) TaxID=1344416 RepID=A0A139ANE7_GONPJ|nr:hypothetical protein M427DRAFT_143994 [Gonapodya prolifera JEL478]|eukprot:KXS18262.1 hypothetical protein M427DRAFT_143994 [Gonapodya prolifera JEL478]